MRAFTSWLIGNLCWEYKLLPPRPQREICLEKIQQNLRHMYLRFWTRLPWKLLVGRKILNQEQLLLCASVATYNCKSTSVFTSWIVDRIDHWSNPSSSNMMCVHIHWIEWCCKSSQDLATLISKPRGSWSLPFVFHLKRWWWVMMVFTFPCEAFDVQIQLARIS